MLAGLREILREERLPVCTGFLYVPNKFLV